MKTSTQHSPRYGCTIDNAVILFTEVIMAIWQQGARAITRRMPKVIDPSTHAVLDYAVAGAFLLAAAGLWKRNRRAAIGSLLCGGATAVNAMFTDYPGGVFPTISYRTHGNVDAGLAGLTASTPRLMGFAGESEARLFGVSAFAETVITGLTDYDYYEEEDGRASN
jgi:hypothetical protein